MSATPAKQRAERRGRAVVTNGGEGDFAMFKNSKAFSSIAVKDIEKARKFYRETLGVDVSDVPGMTGLMQLNLAGGVRVRVYPKPDHVPAQYSVVYLPA